MLRRQNINVLSEHYQKLKEDKEDSDDDEILVPKRIGHDLDESTSNIETSIYSKLDAKLKEDVNSEDEEDEEGDDRDYASDSDEAENPLIYDDDNDDSESAPKQMKRKMKSDSEDDDDDEPETLQIKPQAKKQMTLAEQEQLVLNMLNKKK
jgi:hypothetical protein